MTEKPPMKSKKLRAITGEAAQLVQHTFSKVKDIAKERKEYSKSMTIKKTFGKQAPIDLSDNPFMKTYDKDFEKWAQEGKQFYQPVVFPGLDEDHDFTEKKLELLKTDLSELTGIDVDQLNSSVISTLDIMKLAALR